MLPPSTKDLVVALELPGNELSASSVGMLEEFASKGTSVWHVGFSADGAHLPKRVTLSLGAPRTDLTVLHGAHPRSSGESVCPRAELALKLAINAVSTLAHVHKGCVFGNRMVNLRVTNRKLFFRAASLVASLAKISVEDATSCLQRSIHGVDALPAELAGADASFHVSVASSKDLVVPTAIVLAASPAGTSIAEAREHLSRAASITDAIASL